MNATGELTEKEKASRFKWTVEFEVSGVWVADGFEISDEIALEMLESRLPYSVDGELAARVVKTPDAKAVARIQGN